MRASLNVSTRVTKSSIYYCKHDDNKILDALFTFIMTKTDHKARYQTCSVVKGLPRICLVSFQTFALRSVKNEYNKILYFVIKVLHYYYML